MRCWTRYLTARNVAKTNAPSDPVVEEGRIFHSLCAKLYTRSFTFQNNSCWQSTHCSAVRYCRVSNLILSRWMYGWRGENNLKWSRALPVPTSLRRVVTAARVVEHLHHDHLDNGFRGTGGRAMPSTHCFRTIVAPPNSESSGRTRADEIQQTRYSEHVGMDSIWRKCRAGHAATMRLEGERSATTTLYPPPGNLTLS